MKITVLNGSPRPNGNTAAMVDSFKKGAESKGHIVNVINIGTMKINGCIACEYCHNNGNGKCIQQDEMQSIYPHINDSDMLVIASLFIIGLLVVKPNLLLLDFIALADQTQESMLCYLALGLLAYMMLLFRNTKMY